MKMSHMLGRTVSSLLREQIHILAVLSLTKMALCIFREVYHFSSGNFPVIKLGKTLYSSTIMLLTAFLATLF